MIQAKPMKFKSAEDELIEREQRKEKLARKPRFARHNISKNDKSDEDDPYVF